MAVPGGYVELSGYRSGQGAATDCLVPALATFSVGFLGTGASITAALSLPPQHVPSVAGGGAYAAMLLGSGSFALYGREAYLRSRAVRG
jgi:hypothetical protein